MDSSTNIESFQRRIPFTIDGERFTTSDLSQRASALLRLAGLDPAIFDLGELEGKRPVKPRRFADDEIVTIRKNARFVSIRDSAPVA